MVRLLVQIIGWILIAFGILGILTPIPLGIIFFTLGLMCLVPTSPMVTRWIRRLRRRSSAIDKAFHTMTRKAPMPYRRVLRQTDPDYTGPDVF